MKKKKADRIAHLFNEIEGDNPGMSTEWLMQMTCDVWKQRHGYEIDHGDVAQALYQEAENAGQA